ncbi:MAG: hypothetical protein QM757_23865 [Paludibaculum sp.]
MRRSSRNNELVVSASMDKYKEFRKLYNAAGVKIDIFSLPLAESMSTTSTNTSAPLRRTSGANCITMELPTKAEHSKWLRVLRQSTRSTSATTTTLTSMRTVGDVVLSQSKYNSINLDVGHFTEAINASPIPFIKEHHDRITSFHRRTRSTTRRQRTLGAGRHSVEGGPAVDEEGEVQVAGEHRTGVRRSGFVQRLAEM